MWLCHWDVLRHLCAHVCQMQSEDVQQWRVEQQHSGKETRFFSIFSGNSETLWLPDILYVVDAFSRL